MLQRCVLVQVGNAVTEGKHVVFGPGSSEVLNAALFALTMNLTNGQSASPGIYYCRS